MVARGGHAPRGPQGPLLVLYLAVTTVPLAAGGLSGARAWVLLAHAAAIALVLRTELAVARGEARPWARAFSELQLLVLLPALYAELPFLMEGVPGPLVYRDALVQRLEEALFASQPAWELAGMYPWLWLSEALHLAYLLYFPIIYLPPLLLYAALLSEGEGEARSRMALQETLLALSLSALVCFLVFVVFPVQGPRYLAAPAGVPDGPFRSLALALLRLGSSRGAAFPSAHVSMAVAQTLLALRFQRRLGWVLLPLTALLALGAVYGGFHYAIDALAGAALGAASAWVAPPLGRGFRRGFPGFTPPRQNV